MNFISKANLHSAFTLILLFMCFGVAQAQVPNEPTIFATYPINTGGGILFAPPSDIGGSSITNYQYSIDNGTNWNTPYSLTINPDGTGFLVIGSGLTNCTSYTIKLRAVNASGSGTASASASLTPRASIIGFNWINASVYGQHNWTSVTHGNGLFVAVSNSGIGDRVVMTSPDGFNWSSSSSAPDNDWTSVTYGNGLFVAVASSGTGNRVMTSPDGNFWTSSTSAADNNWNSVTYGNGLFVAVANSGTGNRVMTSPDGITWTSRTSAANNNWNSVTYGNGLFVAVANSGTGNRVMTSPNGITWTSRTSAVDNGWHSVTYGNGLFVAVANSGTGNRVMTSPNGITWTSRTSAADNNWNSVTCGNGPLGQFVAVSDNGTGNRVMTSPDGITWTSRTSSAESNWSNVAYGNGQFVAVSNLGGQEQVMASVIDVAIAADAPVISDATFGTNATVNFTQSSPAQAPIPAITNYEYSINNGSTWTARNPASVVSPITITGLDNGATYNIKIRAINSVGTSCISNMISLSVTPAPTNLVVTPINTGGIIEFSAPAYDGGSNITNYQYSIDNGTNWITPSPAVTASPLIISSGLTNCTPYTIKLRAVNGSGGGTASASASLTPRASAQGINWTSRTSAANNYWISVTYGNGLFVAVAYSGTGNRVMTSPDGITWTSRTSAADNAWFSVTYGNGLFVAVSNSGTGNRVMTSPDGITWTSRTSAADNAWYSVTYGNGLFVAVAYSGTGNRVMTSPDGITWTSRTSAADNDWYSVTYGNGLFVAVSNSGTGNRVMTSPNGITWTSRTSAVDNAWISVTYGNGLFVAVALFGNGNLVMTSPDGINWTSRTSASNNNWNNVTYGNGLFVAVASSGTGNRVMTSTDGITWTSRTSAADNNWYNVTYGNGLFVAVANIGTRQVMTCFPAPAADAPVISASTFGTSATVNFTQSSPALAPAITNYEYSTNNGINWAAVSPAATTSPLTITGLATEPSSIMIRAVNNAGNSCASNNSIICIQKSSTDTITACNSFVWHGNTYTASNNTATWTGANAAGCDSVITLNLTINNATSSTETIVSCNSYTWNGVTYTTSGTKTWRGTNAAGCDSVATLILTISTKIVSPLYGLTQTVISKVCSSSVYRYTASGVAVGTIYNWILPTSIGGVPGVTVDSGDINSSRTLLVRYTSNEAAFTTDSIKVRAFNVCASNYTAVKLNISKLSVPSAPGLITVTSIDANRCSNRRYRFTAPALPAGTNGGNPTYLPATGYLWSFVGNLSEFATIDSGNENSQEIVVRFSSNASAVTGDSIKLQYLSSCGNSLPKALKLSNTKLNVPLAPATITITALQTNVCGARRYRYTAPNLPVASTNYGAATGYLWSLVGSLSGTATIDGDINSRVITVTFSSNAAAATGDSIRVMYTSACGNSAIRASKLTNTLLAAPSVPATITMQIKSDVCNARKYRYIAPAVLPVATSSIGAASGYLWSTPTGTVGSTGTIDSGEVNSRIITVTYSSNAAAGVGDSIRLRYTSGCGDGKIKAQKLTNLIKNGCLPISKNGSTSRVPITLPTSMEVNVYPNPTTSQFNIQVKSTGKEEVVVRVLDLTGRFIKSIKVSSNSNLSLGSDLKAGAYMLEVKQGKEVKMERVVKF